MSGADLLKLLRGIKPTDRFNFSRIDNFNDLSQVDEMNVETGVLVKGKFILDEFELIIVLR
jgi:hypothetical protein